MANRGWDDTEQRLSAGAGKHSTAHNRGLKQKGTMQDVCHMTSLAEQYRNGGEWNTEIPGPGPRQVPPHKYRTGVIDGSGGQQLNVAAQELGIGAATG